MNCFLKLSFAKGDGTVYVNVCNISLMKRDGNCTDIHLTDGSFIKVNETPEEFVKRLPRDWVG